jgi:hypothetical protein
MEALQVDGFQVLHDESIISSISSAAPAPKVLKPKSFCLGCGFYFRFFFVLFF